MWLFFVCSVYPNRTLNAIRSRTTNDATNTDTKFCAPMPSKNHANRQRQLNWSWTVLIWSLTNIVWVLPRYMGYLWVLPSNPNRMLDKKKRKTNEQKYKKNKKTLFLIIIPNYSTNNKRSLYSLSFVMLLFQHLSAYCYCFFYSCLCVCVPRVN